MDFSARGSKPGSGGIVSKEQSNVHRRERLRQLALETADLTNDPYFMKNHLGSYECKLCLTLHSNEGSYLAHTQGKKHQQNLARREAKLAKERGITLAPERKRVVVPKRVVKVGRPGYKVVKQLDAENGQRSLLFQLEYPQIAEGTQPRYRFMSSYEQKVEAPDPSVQYILFAAEPYETIAFKIPKLEIDRDEDKFFTDWDKDRLRYTVQLFFKRERKGPKGAAKEEEHGAGDSMEVTRENPYL